MPTDAPDPDLIERVLAGERECFAVLVRRHASPLWATLRGSLGNLEDAREVFQETWLRAFQGLEGLRERGRLRSWLLAIGLNLARERHRRPRPAGDLDENELPPAAAAGVPDALAGDEERRDLRRELAALPPRQREVMDLRLNHELTHAEVASHLGISEESSRANYYQALRRLRSRLVPEDEAPGRTPKETGR